MRSIAAVDRITEADARIVLRPWEDRDLPVNLMAYDSPETDRFSRPESEPFTAEDAAEYLRHSAIARSVGEALELAIADVEDPSVGFGGISLYDIDGANAAAAIGPWLAAEHRGRGLATEALRLLSAWALRELELERVELTADPRNQAFHRVAERCGFRREGVRRSHLAFKGGRRDSLVFSLLPGELN